ncbi:MAG TPA: aldehyde dehydrogenase family protein, partial [Saprospiraceae bacterium]|nr:aldehyde dehydrogenase family protein [Saprospiraceae bacterium]
MTDAIFSVPLPVNEPVLNYAPGSPEKAALKKALAELKSQVRDLPMFIGGQRVTTAEKGTVRPPHERDHILGHFSRGNATHVRAAIEAAMKAKPAWEAMPWQERAAIFLKAADLLTGPYRARMNAATTTCSLGSCAQSVSRSFPISPGRPKPSRSAIEPGKPDASGAFP